MAWNTSQESTSQNPKHIGKSIFSLIVDLTVLMMNLKVFEQAQCMCAVWSVDAHVLCFC